MFNPGKKKGKTFRRRRSVKTLASMAMLTAGMNKAKFTVL
jgi:hypothetical protein